MNIEAINPELLHLNFFLIDQLLKGKVTIGRYPTPGAKVPCLGEILFNTKHFDKKDFKGYKDYPPDFLDNAKKELAPSVMDEVEQIFLVLSEREMFSFKIEDYKVEYLDLENAFFTEFFFSTR